MAEQTYIIARKQSLLDACIQVYGTSKLLFQFAKDNGLYIDSSVNIGDSLLYDDELGDQDLKNKIEGEDFVINNPVDFFNPLSLGPKIYLSDEKGIITSDVAGTLFLNEQLDQTVNKYDFEQLIGVSRPIFENLSSLYDGLDDYMESKENDILDFDNIGTVVLWIKPSSLLSKVFFTYSSVASNGSYFVLFFTGNKLRLQYSATAGGATAYVQTVDDMNSDVWQMVTLSCNNIDRNKIYINDIEKTTIFVPGVSGFVGNEWTADIFNVTSFSHQIRLSSFFRSTSANTLNFAGLMGKFLYFNKELSPSEITDLYNGTKSKYGL